MDDQFANIFEAHNRHGMSSHFEWTEALRIAIALPLLFAAFFSAFGQSAQPGHLPTKKQVAHMTPATRNLQPTTQRRILSSTIPMFLLVELLL